MSKKILKLEKETNMWKTRCERSNAVIIEMATDKQSRDAEIVQLNKKSSLLQELCKAFQQERANLLVQLKEKTNDPLQSDQLIGSMGDSALNGLVSLDKLENKIIDECPLAKTEETCLITKVDALLNEKKEEIENSSADVDQETNKKENESISIDTAVVNNEKETTSVTEVTHSKTDAKDVAENHIKNVKTEDSSGNSESNSEQANESLKVGNGIEISANVNGEKITQVLVSNETLENDVAKSVVLNADNIQTGKTHVENSDALISNGKIQTCPSDNKTKVSF